MSSIRRPSVAVEQLEQRDCPSLTAMFMNGLLTVSGTPRMGGSGVVFTQTANNQWQVQDGGSSLGTYKASNVSLRVTNHQNTPLTFNLNGHTDSGNISVDLGTGDTSDNPANALALVSGMPGAPSAGTLSGNFSVTNGSGEDNVFLGFTNNATPLSSTVTVAGNVSFTGRSNPNLPASNLLDTGLNLAASDHVTPTVRIGGSVNTSAAGADIATGTTVGFDVTLTAVRTPFRSGSGSDAQIYGNVGRNVTINGSAQSSGDIVFIGGGLSAAGVLMPTQIGGNLSVYTPGSQTNLIEISNGGAGAATVVNGNTLIQTGDGTNLLTMDALFNGNLTLQLGNGVNTDTETASTNPATAASGASQLPFFPSDAAVGGDFQLTAGSGDNNLASTSSGGFAGAVGGTTRITLGDGANAEFVVSTSNPGSQFIWRSGNGGDALTFAGATAPTTYNVNVQFGNADDVFTFNDANSFLTGRVDGGGRFTANQFNFLAGTIEQPFVESNFP